MKELCFIAIQIFLISLSGSSQAVLSTKIDMHGIKVYGDYKDASKYYYAPNKLQLHLESDGQPAFKLIQMRYTGTGGTGDQGEKRFMNIVQFTVKMKAHDNEILKQIQRELGRRVELRPLSLNQVHASLVAPFEGAYKTIGNGSFDTTGKAGTSTKASFWTERIFTVRLENHEAQLLWDMVEDEQIGLSVSYAYYADIINDEVISIESSADSVLEEVEEIKQRDSIATTTLIHADAFNLEVDITRFPEVLMKKDLNEGIPPAYPAVQIACYDFYNELRPDLAMKTIEFQASGLNDNQIKIRPLKFLNINKDLHTLQVRFPYAVDMKKPLKYRIVEISEVGDLEDKGWVSTTSWIGILDISSQVEDIKIHRRTMEFETDTSKFSEVEIDQLDVILEYTYLGEHKSEVISFTEDDLLPVRQYSVLCDIDNSVKYTVKINESERKFFRIKKIVPDDDYVFINVLSESN